MRGKRILIVGGVVAALALPAGVAVAATTDTGPARNGPAVTQNGPVRAGYGDPEDCPYYNSTDAQQWREQRAERQKLSVTERQQLVDQHRQHLRQQVAVPE